MTLKVMVVELPLIERLVVPVEAWALAGEPDDVGEAAVAEELRAPGGALAALAPDEQPISAADKTNTTVIALDDLMESSWSSESRMSPYGDISITTRA